MAPRIETRKLAKQTLSAVEVSELKVNIVVRGGPPGEVVEVYYGDGIAVIKEYGPEVSMDVV